MKTKRILPVLTAMCLLLTACGTYVASESASVSISVYRELRPEYQTDGRLLQAEKVAVEKGTDFVKAAISALNSAPESDRLQNPMPEGMELLNASVEKNCVTVSMNSTYLGLTGIDRTMVDGCITMTLCSIEGIDYVTICVGDDVAEEKLTTEDFLLFNNVTNPNTSQVRLYFPKASGGTLGGEYRLISVDDSNSAERRILDAILDGPSSNSLKRPFPSDTVLLSVYTQDGVCTVSLSDFTSEETNPTSTDAELAVYSLVNSLTEIAGVESVQLLINGSQLQELWGFDISRPLSRNESIIGSAVSD